MSERSATNSRPRKPNKASFSSLPSPPSSPKSQTLTLFPRMRRSLLRPFPLLVLLLSLFLVVTYLFLSPSTNSNPNPNPNPSSSLHLAASNSIAPKIYLYDLPRKFTYGVIESYAAARGAAATDPLKYPGHQHSGEWFLFDDLNRADRAGSPLQRTLDPDEADLFYVPFFSSLSLIVNPIRPAEGVKGPVYSDEGMQEELIDWLEGNKYWKRNNGRDHVFIAQDPNALYKVIDKVRKGILLVSDFGRLKGDQASLVKDVILPYSHRIKTYDGEIGVENRKSLLFFMGNRYRKEGGKIRDTLFQILEPENDVVIKHGTQSRVSRRMATQGMHSSKFCLHPAGDTPSACRLFDAIVSLCVPVIVSDNIELPFEDVIDYKKIAVFVDTETAVKPGYLTSLLRRTSKETILQYQREMKLVKRYFEYDDPNGAVNEIWHQVSSKVPLVKLMINREKRLVAGGSSDPDCSCICTGRNGTNIGL